MKHIFCQLLVLIFLLPLFSQENVNIAVLELEGAGVSKTDLIGLSNRLRSGLFKTGKFTVLERSRMDEILKEQGFQLSGCTNTDCAVEIGKLIGVTKIVLGNIDKVGTIYSTEIRMVDVGTGKIEKVASEDCEDCNLNDVLQISIANVSKKMAGIGLTNSEMRKSIKNDNAKISTKINNSTSIYSNGLGVKYTIPISFGLNYIHSFNPNISISAFFIKVIDDKVTLGDWDGGAIYLYSDPYSILGLNLKYQFQAFIKPFVSIESQIIFIDNIRFHESSNEEMYLDSKNMFRGNIGVGFIISLNRICFEVEAKYFLLTNSDWIKESFNDYSRINDPGRIGGTPGLREIFDFELSASFNFLF